MIKVILYDGITHPAATPKVPALMVTIIISNND